MRNSLRIWTLLALFSLALMLAGQAVFDRRGMIWGLTISLGINACVYLFGHRRLLKLFPIVRLEGQDPWGLLPLVAKLAEKAGVDTPEVFLSPLRLPTSWSVGRGWRHSKIVLSEGLLRELPLEQVAATIAFELARIRRHDTLAIGMAVGMAGAVSSPYRYLENFASGPWWLRSAAHIAARGLKWILEPFAAFIVRLALNRNDVYSADIETVALIGQTEVWGETLWNLSSFSRRYTLPIQWSDSAAFSLAPQVTPNWARWMNLQPSSRQRIKKLVGRFPL